MGVSDADHTHWDLDAKSRDDRVYLARWSVFVILLMETNRSSITTGLHVTAFMYIWVSRVIRMELQEFNVLEHLNGF